MIRPDELQSLVVAKIKASAWLVFLGLVVEVREAQWHGAAFNYPNIRVDRPLLVAKPWSGACSDRVSDAVISISIHSKKDSSVNVQLLQGLIEENLRGVQLSSSALRTTALHPLSHEPAVPNPQNPDTWVGVSRYKAIVTER